MLLSIIFFPVKVSHDNELRLKTEANRDKEADASYNANKLLVLYIASAKVYKV